MLRDRPYHPWRLIPLASTLIELGYSDAVRNRIVDFIEDGGFLESLIVDGTLEPEDLEAAKHALESGRAWWARYSSRAVPPSAAIVPPELEPGDDGWIDPTADADGDPIHTDDREAPAEYIPSDADLADYGRWLAEQERAQAEHEDGMAFPEAEYSLEDRRRWDRQNRLADDWYRTFVAD